MPLLSKNAQCVATLPLTLNDATDPLPSDPQGQHLCEIFGRYLWCSIFADAPDNADEKAQWKTQRRYRLKNRVLWRDWQDAALLIGVRPGNDSVYALIDIDINSPYHPKQDAGAIARIEAALETIGFTRTIRIRSSWSEGIHLYLPLPEPVKTFDLAVALKNCLEPQGFKLKLGHLECFPNAKAYGNIIKTEYLAHRLPLQPGSGSYLLDDAFNPSGESLEKFLHLWDIAAAGQDIAAIRQALPLARANRFKKVRKRLNKVDSWQQDLETVIAEGWTGPAQTNQLLKEFGCYGHVFLGHCGDDLVNFIHQQAIASPGYKKWCRHQREILMRSRVWATAIEKYYWPIGSYSDARQRAASNVASFNDLRAQSAQQSIIAIVQHLEAINALPEQTTMRAQAIRKAQADLGNASSSLETLYKSENKKLWHPDFYLNVNEISASLQPVINAISDISESEEALVSTPLKTLEPFLDEELRTEEEIMKCEGAQTAVLISSKTKFYSGKGGAGGEKGFPQAIRLQKAFADSTVAPVDQCPIEGRHRPLLTPANQTIESYTKPKQLVLRNQQAHHAEAKCLNEISETIAAIQVVIQKLKWPIEKIHNFIAGKFQGRRRYQLADDELLDLLYYLRTEPLWTKSP